MPIETINLGNYANDGTGDDLRTAFIKVNNNFSLLQNEVNVVDGVNIGTGIGIFSDRVGPTFEFKSLTSIDDSIEITPDASTVNIRATARLINDSNPTLSSDLDLNTHNIVGDGDVQTTVYGIDIRILSGMLSLLIQGNQVSFDLGSFLYPINVDLDMGSFAGDYYTGTELDFGYF